MVASAALIAASVAAVLQVVAGLLVATSRASLAQRLPVALLFGFNGVIVGSVVLALSGESSLPRPWLVFFDTCTGFLLMATGAVLAGVSRVAFRRTAVLGIAGAGGFAVLVASLGASSTVAILAADLVVHGGWLAAAVGALALSSRSRSVFGAAVVLAFLPRAIEGAGYALLIAWQTAQGTWNTASLELVWRLPFAVALGWALWRRSLGARGAVGVALLLGIVAFGGGFFVGTGWPTFTLALPRPVFFVVGIVLSGPGDLFFMPRASAIGRLGGTLAGFATGTGLTLVLPLFGATGLAQMLTSFALGLIGFALGGLPFPDTTPAAVLLDGETQGRRLLVALLDVEFGPEEPAPAASTTKHLAAVIGVQGKHLPALVRRLNAGHGSVLVLADRGPVRGARWRELPRYRLSPEGRRLAREMADATVKTNPQ